MDALALRCYRRLVLSLHINLSLARFRCPARWGRRSERDAEKRLRVQAENDARRAKAAADQAAAAAAAASRSLKVGEKQIGNSSKDGEVIGADVVRVCMHAFVLSCRV